VGSKDHNRAAVVGGSKDPSITMEMVVVVGVVGNDDHNRAVEVVVGDNKVQQKVENV